MHFDSPVRSELSEEKAEALALPTTLGPKTTSVAEPSRLSGRHLSTQEHALDGSFDINVACEWLEDVQQEDLCLPNTNFEAWRAVQNVVE